MKEKFINLDLLLDQCGVDNFTPDIDRLKSWIDRHLLKGFYIGDEFYMDIEGFMPPKKVRNVNSLFEPDVWYTNEEIRELTGISKQAIWRKVTYYNLGFKRDARDKFRKIYLGAELNAIFE